MSSLFVITSIRNTKNIAGIPHSKAIANIEGAAIFGFRKLPLAARFARAVDERIADNSDFVFSEDLLEPFSHLVKGQHVHFKYDSELEKNVRFDNVIIGRVKEEEIVNYCSAMQISAVLLGETISNETVYIEDILSPARSLAYSAGYLDYLYNMDDDEE
ncbi:hypothetical protein PBCVNEJV1_316R [Paramecium bursaria Chlorella virus NE-JV-1]|nr:hypothetical protein PBCVNEJV1_316R [Paramecium bursaria Chlorella virus NE-JV-1]